MLSFGNAFKTGKQSAITTARKGSMLCTGGSKKHGKKAGGRSRYQIAFANDADAWGGNVFNSAACLF